MNISRFGKGAFLFVALLVVLGTSITRWVWREPISTVARLAKF